MAEGLVEWWRRTAAEDAGRCASKARDYGSVDLEIMGGALLLMMDRPDEPPRVGLEMAVGFYVLGKVARAISAFQRGGLPTDDTWEDLTAYSMMARRVREVGRWP